MVKIIHPLLCYYPSQAGGPANTLYWLNSALNSDKFTCAILATKYGVDKNIDRKVFGTNHRAVFLDTKGLSFLNQSFRELRSSSIVQFSSLFFPPTLPILLVAVVKRKSIIMSPRGELYTAAINQKKIKKQIWLSMIKMFQNKIHFHATNGFELDLIQKTFPKAKSTIVIPNFIKMPDRQNRDIKMTFVFVGRLNPIKNIHLLIAAIANVYKTHPTIKLEIVGSARLDYEKTYEASLHSQIKQLDLEQVISFKGHLDGDEKNKIIASSKALILPSKSENFGNVVLEALAQGTPVIASKNTPWALLEEHGAGFWIESTIQQLTHSMLQLLLLNENRYKNMRKNALDLCTSHFDIKTKSQVWENYYQQITSYV